MGCSAATLREIAYRGVETAIEEFLAAEGEEKRSVREVAAKILPRLDADVSAILLSEGTVEFTRRILRKRSRAANRRRQAKPRSGLSRIVGEVLRKDKGTTP